LSSIVTNGQCETSKTHFICPNSKVVVKKVDKENIIISIKSGYFCDNVSTNFALEGKLYCIGRQEAEVVFENPKFQLKIDFGILAVPFKFENSSYKVYTGGVNGFFGTKINFAKHKEFQISPIAFGGFSSIPLNNLTGTNSADIKTTMGLSSGLGLVLNLKQGFQVGLIKGWDFFNVENSQKTLSWISFSIGYQFLKKD
jgi:hypothetical protein